MHRARLRVARATSDDDGFSLIEVLVAIFLVTLVMGASIAFFINNLKGVSGQSQRQEAIYLADQQLETAQSTPVQPTNMLIHNRSQSAVNALLATSVASRLRISSQDDTTNSGNYDASAAVGKTGDIPTQAGPKTVNHTAYTLYTFIDVCWLDASSGICGPTQTSTTSMEYRVTVDVTWSGVQGGTGCSGGCDYSSSSIIDPSGDPLFNNNLSTVTISACTPGTVNNDNGTPGTQVTCTGTGIKAGARVTIQSGGGTINNVAVGLGGTSVSFYLAAGDSPGSYVISVINPDGGHDQTSLTELPVITSVSPSKVLVGTSQTLTLTGGGFESGASVTDTDPGSTISNVTWVSPTSMTLTYSDTSSGTTTLTITNLDGSTASTTITVNPLPTITNISPSSVPKGTAKTLTLTGTGFQTGATLTVTNGTYTSLNVISSTSATVTFTGTANGTATIKFVNPDGGTSAAYSISVTTVALPPVIASVTPTTMTHNVATTFTITGSNFVTGATVAFNWSGWPWDGNPLPISNVTVQSSTRITFSYTTPNWSPTWTLPVTVTVTNPDGQSSNVYNLSVSVNR